VRWTGHETGVDERRNKSKVLVEKLKEGDHLEILGLVGSLIL
jgi:hypothetical protein